MRVSDHTICDVCEQPAVSSGSQQLAAVMAELQPGEARSIGLYSSYSLQSRAMKQENAGLQPQPGSGQEREGKARQTGEWRGKCVYGHNNASWRMAQVIAAEI